MIDDSRSTRKILITISIGVVLLLIAYFVIAGLKKPAKSEDFQDSVAEQVRINEQAKAFMSHYSDQSPLSRKCLEKILVDKNTYLDFKKIDSSIVKEYGIDTKYYEHGKPLVVENFYEIAYKNLKLVIIDYAYVGPRKKLFVVGKKNVELKVPKGYIEPKLIVLGPEIPPYLMITESGGARQTYNTGKH